jgi:hypothetical protein
VLLDEVSGVSLLNVGVSLETVRFLVKAALSRFLDLDGVILLKLEDSRGEFLLDILTDFFQFVICFLKIFRRRR